LRRIVANNKSARIARHPYLQVQLPCEHGEPIIWRRGHRHSPWILYGRCAEELYCAGSGGSFRGGVGTFGLAGRMMVARLRADEWDLQAGGHAVSYGP
jgi:hypothetical protein